MDPLSDVITLLRPSTAISKPITGKGQWGVRYAAQNAPGFTIILNGECWITIADDAPVKLEKGDFLLLPATPPLSLSSHPGVACELREPTAAALRHGEQEGEPDFASLGGTFRIEQVNAALLLALIPRVVHVPASQGRAGTLGKVVKLIMDECEQDHPGKEMILQRLLEVLLVEALRWRGVEMEAGGMLSGMRDPNLGRALRAMHADIRAGWTVAELATIAGLSRSAFAARFGEVVGCGPVEYLGRWRMAVAKDALRQGVKTLDRIADEIGYESASAFSTAFRKRLGCSPGTFARKRETVTPASEDYHAD
ncbi:MULTISPECIES: AraC family transcriptional regulator [Agrobacterium tumefaciens complex]|uniref:AraC family transcriptional regulator n=1 Tax=Agrobacterium tumefaciens complex TaxID=1183400 RepID=UPI001572604D|nr:MULTISPECIES: AraC family transcriptional regulator [Agrobacterium tumefaciens complex]MCR6726810.1 AraC family transcriptional regulator [Agrobacterium fabrum]WCJ64436.1 AraC family transcriptional regulator [Agrobacterium tumefaciens]